jgi:glycosyltransferase involved in cell wall biosynthesis
MENGISVVVPTYNVARFLDASLRSIEAALQEVGGGELIVVDNGSTDGTQELLAEQWAGKAKLARLPSKTISAVRNHGARLATGKILVFLDSDCLVPSGFLRRALVVMESTGASALSFPDEPPQPAPWIEETWHRLHRPPRDGHIPTLYGGNCMLRREVFLRTGGFDESLATGEDSDLGQRIVEGGDRIYLTNELTVIHLGNPKTLGGFFRRQAWHGLGMWSGLGKGGGFLVPALTLLHLFLILAGVVYLLAGQSPISLRGAAALALAIAPAGAAVCYRYLQIGRVFRPCRSLLLYFLYLTARALSPLLLLTARETPGEMPRRLWWRR